MKNEQELTDTIELNVEKARKAAGRLFDEDDVTETHEDVIVSGYGSGNPYYRKKTEPALPDNNEWPEDEWTLPPSPKPAVKVNPSVPAASRSPSPGPADPRGADHDLPKPRAARSRYLFLDDDDEFATFRQRYSLNKRTRKERQSSSVAPARKEERDPRAAARMESVQRAPAKAPPMRKRPPADIGPPVGDVYVSSGMPAPIRWLLIGLLVILLMMMVFLVQRNSALGQELEEANTRLTGLPSLEEDLARITFELYETQVSLAEAESQIASLVAGSVQQVGPPPGEPDLAPPPGEGTDYTPYVPATPPPGGPRTHIVVPGDNLYRISTRFYGNGNPSNIQRIMEANNITDPDSIQVGAQLTIP